MWTFQNYRFYDPLPRYDLTGRPENIGKREMNNDFSQKYYIVKGIQDKNSVA